MRFSLLFLVFLLIWAALITNGWILQIRNDTTAEELAMVQGLSEKISISEEERALIKEYETKLAQTQDVREFHSRLIAAVNEARFQQVDLDSIPIESAAFGFYKREQTDPYRSRPIAYRVRIPGNRKIAVEAMLKEVPKNH